MAAFRLEYEHRRLKEQGASFSFRDSMNDQLRSLVTERTETVNPFTMYVDGSNVTVKGFEHRGDVSVTLQKSVEEAETDLIAKRFDLENNGYDAAKKEFCKLPLYSTVLLMSPPPAIPIEGYPGYNLAYFYHILPGVKEGQRTIKALSFINKFDKEEQAEILNRLSFSNSVMPTESSILLSPVGVSTDSKDTQSFKIMWDEITRIYNKKQRSFQLMPYSMAEQFLLRGDELWNDKHKTLSVMIAEIAEKIANGVSEQDLKDEWAILFNLADNQLLHQDVTKEIKEKESGQDSYRQRAVVFEQYRHLTYQPRVAATSCGSSSGLGQNNNPSEIHNPLENLLKQQTMIKTGTFTVEDAKNDPNLCRCGGKEPHFHCPGEKGACKHPIIVGEGTTECPSCGEGKVC